MGNRMTLSKKSSRRTEDHYLQTSGEKVNPGNGNTIERTHAFFTHDWGEGGRNHALISQINSLLRKFGIITWFDEERMSGDIQHEMAEGIENTLCVVVFITSRYRNKVNGKDARDNCRFEFKHAALMLGAHKMIPVVVDKSMRDTRTWAGVLGGNLGSMLYIDMTDHDEASLAAKSVELYNRIVQVAGLSLPMRSASSSDAKVSPPSSEVEELRRQVAEMQEQMKAATIFSQSSGSKENTNRPAQDPKLVHTQSSGAKESTNQSPAQDGRLVRTDADIRAAVNLWCSNRAAAERKYGHISQWDTSAVTDMKDLFKNMKDFNDDISKWNVGNVTNMYRMFWSASAFNQPLEQWNVGNVTNMQSMFWSAHAFNQPIGQWNVGNVADMGWMFCDAHAFNQPIEQWNVGNVTTMKGMFYNASAFNQPIGQWNVGNVTNMGSMFSGSGMRRGNKPRWLR